MKKIFKTFVITAGHSNVDPGAVAQGEKESALMADLRNIVALKLRQLGHKVLTDGEGKDNQPLSTALKLKGDLAVELHTNAAANAKATGVEVLALPKHKAISQDIAAAIANTLNLPLRGDKGFKTQDQSARGKLAFVQNGGLIVETFFISNLGDLSAYKDKKWLVAGAIANALDDWANKQ